MRTCRARSVHLLGGSRLTSLSSTRRDRHTLPWLFSIRCLGPACSREPVFPCYREQPPSKTSDWLGQLAPAITPCGRLLHRHVSATEVGAVEAPTIRRSRACRRSQQFSRYREVGLSGSRR